MTFAQRAAADQAGDAELITAVRDGDRSAYAILYQRHREAAYRLARQFARSPSEADDLVAESFARVFDTLLAGKGPDTAFRAYLLTSLRNGFYDSARRDKRVNFTDDIEAHDQGVPFVDTAIEGLESSLAARAYARLPERWQAVLWHTEIEGESPATVAPILGMTPNGVAALAYRAREGLRQAYLQQHLADTADAGCQTTVERLGAWARGGLSKREKAQVDAHLATCDRCAGLAAELADVNSGLRGVVAVLVLGTATIPYLAAGTTAKLAAVAAAAAAGSSSSGAVAGTASAGAAVAGAMPGGSGVSAAGAVSGAGGMAGSGAMAGGTAIGGAGTAGAAVGGAAAASGAGAAGAAAVAGAAAAGAGISALVGAGSGAGAAGAGTAGSPAAATASAAAGTAPAASATAAGAIVPAMGVPAKLIHLIAVKAAAAPAPVIAAVVAAVAAVAVAVTFVVSGQGPGGNAPVAGGGLNPGVGAVATDSAGGSAGGSGGATTSPSPTGTGTAGGSASGQVPSDASSPGTGSAETESSGPSDGGSSTTSSIAPGQSTTSSQGQPSGTQTSTTEPGTTQPSTTQPSTTQPSTTQPSTTQPSTTQPTKPTKTQPTKPQPPPPPPTAGADLSVTNPVGTTTIAAGGSAVLRLTIGNGGSAATGTISLTLGLPSGVAVCEASPGWVIRSSPACPADGVPVVNAVPGTAPFFPMAPAGAGTTAGSVLITGPSVPAKGSRTLVLTLTAGPGTAVGAAAVSVTVRWQEKGHPFASTGSVALLVTPPIAAARIAATGSGSVGGAAAGALTASIANTGTAAAQNLTVRLALPAGVSICAAPAGWTLSPVLPCVAGAAAGGTSTVVLTGPDLPSGRTIPLAVGLVSSPAVLAGPASIAVVLAWTENGNPFTVSSALELTIRPPAVALPGAAVSFTGQVGAAVVGNTLLGCGRPRLAGAKIPCSAAINRSTGAVNDSFYLVNKPDPLGLIRSSSAALTVPAGALVESATLYWAAWTSTVGDLPMLDVRFGPVGAQSTVAGSRSSPSAVGTSYSADVTAGVTAGGTYAFSAQAASPALPNSYAGWALVVIYSSAVLPVQTVSVLDSINSDGRSFEVGDGSQSSVSVGMVGFEGDAGKDDTASLGTTTVDDPAAAKVDGAVEGPDQNGFGVDAQTTMVTSDEPVSTLRLFRGADGFCLTALVVTSVAG